MDVDEKAEPEAKAAASSDSDSSSSDSDSSDSDSDSGEKKEDAPAEKPAAAELKADSSSSSSSSSSSDSGSDSDSDSDSDSQGKKENAAPKTEAKAPAPKEVEVEEAPATDGPPAGRTRSQNKPFQRVNVEEFMGKKGSWDMSYEATFGEGGVGWKAQAVLGQVKGDRFRHEKNKRKRSTYRGGLIDDAKVNSIKFDYSDDEK
jgi:hypothetical protein